MEQNLKTIIVVRPGYGKRYTGLPVDEIDRGGFTINCDGGYMRPDLYDLRPGDIVRWRQSERYVEGCILTVTRDEKRLSATLDNVAPLPPDFFPY